jgi:succinate dehydrogenase flavin-adding protein (antitoxin of CptAB toxin-antitoxin module)
MKAIKSTSVTKLIDRFDNELRTLLMNDLEAIKAAKATIVKSIHQANQLSVA